MGDVNGFCAPMHWSTAGLAGARSLLTVAKVADGVLVAEPASGKRDWWSARWSAAREPLLERWWLQTLVLAVLHARWCFQIAHPKPDS
jgi:hypothetical protein